MSIIYEDPLAFLRPKLFADELSTFFHDHGFHTLSEHYHEVVLSFLFYHSIYLSSRFLAPLICKPYQNLSKRTRVNFDIHVVSQVQAFVIMAMSIPLLGDQYLAQDRIYASTPYSSLVASMAFGYFIWDSYICVKNINLFGPQFVLHGVASMFVFSQGMRPLIHYYQPHFLAFELSTPFVNVHWFATHLPDGYIPTTIKVYNGLVLMVVFFLCRIVWGNYKAIGLGTDFLSSYNNKLAPAWSYLSILFLYIALSFLNIFWFSKMVSAALSHFSPKKKAD